MNAKELNIQAIEFHVFARDAIVRLHNDEKVGEQGYWAQIIRWTTLKFPDVRLTHIEDHSWNNGKGRYEEQAYHFELDSPAKAWRAVLPKYHYFLGSWLPQTTPASDRAIRVEELAPCST